jgi:hypothetical protein
MDDEMMQRAKDIAHAIRGTGLPDSEAVENGQYAILAFAAEYAAHLEAPVRELEDPQRQRAPETLAGDDKPGATDAEVACARALASDFVDAIARRIPEGITHEDVISAAVNVAAHHAAKLGMQVSALFAYVVEAYDLHDRSADREKGPG